ncbi:WD40/YVTN repeat-like-containing domain protein [Moelleriella libera RCEF 2490]|uniref:WD40/YVTN repeat-like-containing domain protein n=1 Tax=Moelleriella libera RCEF 2490 TaxID=1081109 RepID=A0A166PUX3_9HYPO|nr:WD40/YVTN repeat-like-containing domain protein [Moelleriella libera RCEF 2490]
MASDLTLILLDHLPTSAIAEIVQRLHPRLYIDFVQHLPAEICLKILGYLDPLSLIGVARTCRAWYELALDRKLWERLYHLEGWKAVTTEIEDAETKINAGLRSSIGHLHRLQDARDHFYRQQTSRSEDGDLEMHDLDRSGSRPSDGRATENSVFGGPAPSSSSHIGDAATDTSADRGSSSKGKDVDWGLGSPDVVRVKRKEPGGTPEPSLPPTTQPDGLDATIRSGLWAWDIHKSSYRICWKYLYTLRRRLESNWELGKYTTFQLPHPRYPEEGHQECVYTLQFDANWLVSGSRDQTMRVWNIRTRRLARKPLVGHSGSVLCLQFDASPEEDILVSGSSDSDVFVWKFSTGEIMQRITTAHHESVLNVRFDKRILVTSSKDKTIKIFNRRTLRFGEPGYTKNTMFAAVGLPVKRYGYDPDLSQQMPVKEPWTVIGRLEGHGAAVNAIQVLDKTIVSVSGDRQIKVWNWPDEVCIQTIPAHDKGIACVEFDGRRIVSGSSDYEVCIFDAATGLKVAQLRGHAHLVRTVQAGFGDMPHSRHEDEIAAKMVDAEYFKAIEAGEISHDGSERRTCRTRRANAGSSRPNDLQAFGAKVPPGGGGGRKYGRIVSGSYDQSIIIWRRDKEGVWKPAHHLRQEEAAAAAQRQASLPSAASTQFTAALQPFTLPPLTHTSSPTPDSIQLHGTAQALSEVDSAGYGPYGPYAPVIDQVVAQGPLALAEALRTQPTILSNHTYLQSAIEREQSPLVRLQLRHIVTSALVTVQRRQLMSQRLAGSSAPFPFVGPAHVSNLSAGLGLSGFAADGATSRAPFPPIGSAHVSNLSAGVGLSGSGADGATSRASLTSAGQPTQAAAPTTSEAATRRVLPPIPVAAPVPATAQPTHLHTMQLVPPPHHHHHLNHHHHHPHIVAAENTPARVFKLQFDARKIVCCSQASIIVGWDFCNGDEDLEEASRFFATVD